MNGSELMSSNHKRHPLEVWLNDNGVTVAEFTRQLKRTGVHVTRYTIDLWLLDESTPNLRNAYAIGLATGGTVSMETLARWSLGIEEDVTQ